MTRALIEQSRQTPPAFLGGWGGVPEHTNWMDEQMSWKETCYLGDWSFLAAFEVEGPDALKLFSDISVNSFVKFDVGQAKHAIQCNKDGKVITEGILLRLDEQRFCVQSAPAFYAAHMLQSGGYNARGKFVDWFFYQVQGPNALAVLENLMGDNLREVGFMRFRRTQINGHDVLALRQGMSGELGGFEIQGVNDSSAPEIHEAILRAGKELGIRRLGQRSAMINHLEAWYPTITHHYMPALFGPDMADFRAYMDADTPMQQGYPQSGSGYLRRSAAIRNLTGSYEGNDISDYYRSPVELGWTKNIKFDHDFIGRRALEVEVANPTRVGVTLEFNADDVIDVFASAFRADEPCRPMDLPHNLKSASHASKILKDGKLVGIASHPAYSLFFRKVLAISCIDIASSEPGTQVVVVWGEPGRRQKELRATVASAPYKKDSRRGSLPRTS